MNTRTNDSGDFNSIEAQSQKAISDAGNSSRDNTEQPKDELVPYGPSLEIEVVEETKDDPGLLPQLPELEEVSISLMHGNADIKPIPSVHGITPQRFLDAVKNGRASDYESMGLTSEQLGAVLSAYLPIGTVVDAEPQHMSKALKPFSPDLNPHLFDQVTLYANRGMGVARLKQVITDIISELYNDDRALRDRLVSTVTFAPQSILVGAVNGGGQDLFAPTNYSVVASNAGLGLYAFSVKLGKKVALYKDKYAQLVKDRPNIPKAVNWTKEDAKMWGAQIDHTVRALYSFRQADFVPNALMDQSIRTFFGEENSQVTCFTLGQSVASVVQRLVFRNAQASDTAQFVIRSFFVTDNDVPASTRQIFLNCLNSYVYGQGTVMGVITRMKGINAACEFFHSQDVDYNTKTVSCIYFSASPTGVDLHPQTEVNRATVVGGLMRAVIPGGIPILQFMLSQDKIFSESAISLTSMLHSFYRGYAKSEKCTEALSYSTSYLGDENSFAKIIGAVNSQAKAGAWYVTADPASGQGGIKTGLKISNGEVGVPTLYMNAQQFLIKLFQPSVINPRMAMYLIRPLCQTVAKVKSESIDTTKVNTKVRLYCSSGQPSQAFPSAVISAVEAYAPTFQTPLAQEHLQEIFGTYFANLRFVKIFYEKHRHFDDCLKNDGSVSEIGHAKFGEHFFTMYGCFIPLFFADEGEDLVAWAIANGYMGHFNPNSPPGIIALMGDFVIPGLQFALYYSDNLNLFYVNDEGTDWNTCSLDGKTFEAQASQSGQAYVNIVALHNTDTSFAKIGVETLLEWYRQLVFMDESEPFSSLVVEILDQSAAEQIELIKLLQLYLYVWSGENVSFMGQGLGRIGLQSGVAWTTFDNSARMSTVVGHVMQKQISFREIDAYFNHTGVIPNYKIEVFFNEGQMCLYSDELKRPLSELSDEYNVEWQSNFIEEHPYLRLQMAAKVMLRRDKHQHNILRVYTAGDEAEIDLLGFNVIKASDNYPIMVLRGDSMLKTFNKPCRDSQVNDLVSSLTGIFKYEAMWVSGAYRETPIPTSSGTITHLRQYVKAAYSDCVNRFIAALSEQGLINLEEDDLRDVIMARTEKEEAPEELDEVGGIKRTWVEVVTVSVRRLKDGSLFNLPSWKRIREINNYVVQHKVAIPEHVDMDRVYEFPDGPLAPTENTLPDLREAITSFFQKVKRDAIDGETRNYGVIKMTLSFYEQKLFEVIGEASTLLNELLHQLSSPQTQVHYASIVSALESNSASILSDALANFKLFVLDLLYKIDKKQILSHIPKFNQLLIGPLFCALGTFVLPNQPDPTVALVEDHILAYFSHAVTQYLVACSFESDQEFFMEFDSLKEGVAVLDRAPRLDPTATAEGVERALKTLREEQARSLDTYLNSQLAEDVDKTQYRAKMRQHMNATELTHASTQYATNQRNELFKLIDGVRVNQAILDQEASEVAYANRTRQTGKMGRRRTEQQNLKMERTQARWLLKQELEAEERLVAKANRGTRLSRGDLATLSASLSIIPTRGADVIRQFPLTQEYTFYHTKQDGKFHLCAAPINKWIRNCALDAQFENQFRQAKIWKSSHPSQFRKIWSEEKAKLQDFQFVVSVSGSTKAQYDQFKDLTSSSNISSIALQGVAHGLGKRLAQPGLMDQKHRRAVLNHFIMTYQRLSAVNVVTYKQYAIDTAWNAVKTHYKSMQPSFYAAIGNRFMAELQKLASLVAGDQTLVGLEQSLNRLAYGDPRGLRQLAMWCANVLHVPILKVGAFVAQALMLTPRFDFVYGTYHLRNQLRSGQFKLVRTALASYFSITAARTAFTLMLNTYKLDVERCVVAFQKILATENDIKQVNEYVKVEITADYLPQLMKTLFGYENISLSNDSIEYKRSADTFFNILEEANLNKLRSLCTALMDIMAQFSGKTDNPDVPWQFLRGTPDLSKGLVVFKEILQFLDSLLHRVNRVEAMKSYLRSSALFILPVDMPVIVNKFQKAAASAVDMFVAQLNLAYEKMPRKPKVIPWVVTNAIQLVLSSFQAAIQKYKLEGTLAFKGASDKDSQPESTGPKWYSGFDRDAFSDVDMDESLWARLEMPPKVKDDCRLLAIAAMNEIDQLLHTRTARKNALEALLQVFYVNVRSKLFLRLGIQHLQGYEEVKGETSFYQVTMITIPRDMLQADVKDKQASTQAQGQNRLAFGAYSRLIHSQIKIGRQDPSLYFSSQNQDVADRSVVMIPRVSTFSLLEAIKGVKHPSLPRNPNSGYDVYVGIKQYAKKANTPQALGVLFQMFKAIIDGYSSTVEPDPALRSVSRFNPFSPLSVFLHAKDKVSQKDPRISTVNELGIQTKKTDLDKEFRTFQALGVWSDFLINQSRTLEFLADYSDLSTVPFELVWNSTLGLPPDSLWTKAFATYNTKITSKGLDFHKGKLVLQEMEYMLLNWFSFYNHDHVYISSPYFLGTKNTPELHTPVYHPKTPSLNDRYFGFAYSASRHNVTQIYLTILQKNFPVVYKTITKASIQEVADVIQKQRDNNKSEVEDAPVVEVVNTSAVVPRDYRKGNKRLAVADLV